MYSNSNCKRSDYIVMLNLCILVLYGLFFIIVKYDFCIVVVYEEIVIYM